MPPSIHFTTTSTTSILPFRTSFPPSSIFVPLDQSLWMEGPSLSQPQEHTCPHYQRTESIVNNLQNEMRFMLEHILVWILQKPQENGQKWANTNTRMKEHTKSRKFSTKANPWSTPSQTESTPGQQ
ncbi:hypothetical protein Tco_1013763 [Tanacetum coccineum]